MSSNKQSAITFFSTNQMDKIHEVSDFHFADNHPIYIATSEKQFSEFMHFYVNKLISSGVGAKFRKAEPVLIDFTKKSAAKYSSLLNEVFPIIINAQDEDLVILKKEEVIGLLQKEEHIRKMRAISVKAILSLGVFIVTKADFNKLIVKMKSLRINEDGPKPNFEDIEIIDFGGAIRFGEYEASMRSLLYENDREYRLEQKKQRLASEGSFGACLRRYRLLKSINQTDFLSVSEKTIRRIEDGDHPKESTKAKILEELGIKLEELLSY